MVELVPLVIASFFVLLSVWMILDGAGKVRTWNQLRGMNTQQVTDAGFVEVEGTAEPLDETTTSPMTNTESLVYEFAVEEQRADDDGTTEWRAVKSDSDAVPFVVEMDEDSVVVDATQLDGEDTYIRGPQEHHGGRRHSESRLDPGDIWLVVILTCVNETSIWEASKNTDGKPCDDTVFTWLNTLNRQWLELVGDHHVEEGDSARWLRKTAPRHVTGTVRHTSSPTRSR